MKADTIEPPFTSTKKPSSSSNCIPQQELILFAEKDEVLECIASLNSTTSSSTTHASSSSSLQRLRDIFDKYLECPTLLDPSLEDLVQKFAAMVLDGGALLLNGDKDNEKNDPLSNNAVAVQQRVQYPLSALYALSKVRGYKVVRRFLPHGVQQVEIVWQVMRQCKAYERQQQKQQQQHASNSRNGHDSSPAAATANDNNNNALLSSSSLPPIWESIYMLRHWLGALSMVPFDSKIFDNSEVHGGFAVNQLLANCQEELDQAGPLREAAAACLAAWLSRPDLETTALPPFVTWTQSVVNGFANKVPPQQSSLHANNNLFRLMGACQVLCHLLKRSSVARQTLVHLLQPLWDPLLVLANDSVVANNLLLRKLLNKWWTRMSCAYLPPPCRARYRRGQRALLGASSSNDKTSFSTKEEETMQISMQQTDTATMANQQHEDWFLVPDLDLVEDATGRLLEALGHTSTVVRWSAAKGVGRITERLPVLCAEDVLDTVLEMFQNYEKDQSWHGACLSLAELARRGLLLPHRLDHVIPHVVTAVHYDFRRGNSSVGAHVRDAACYTFWAFARAYPPDVLRNYIQPLAVSVVLTSLFDREVNCRRAASAAFQEAVGRQGALNFPNGIAIITAADFFSLGNRKEAYTSIAMQVAQFEEYRLPIFKHLYQEKLFHWDITIRKLASIALAKLSKYDPAFLGEHAIPFLAEKSLDNTSVIVRHGAVLGVAELTKAFGEQNVLTSALSDHSRALIVELVGEIDKRRLYRGRGGEIMRSACCRLVECISCSKLLLTVKDQVKMLDTVDACIPHPSEEIQECACSALGQLLHAYFPVGEQGPSDRLQSRVVDKFIKQLRTSPNVAVTRGYALALGFLPAKLVAPSESILGEILVALRETARPTAKVGNEGDAETRRNALLSFSRIVRTLQSSVGSTTSYPVSGLNDKHVKGILGVYFSSLEDYNTDRRGDVGSWCRMAAISGLTAFMTIDRPSDDQVDWGVDSTTPTKVVGEFLKQIGEKLDAVRLHAGKNLYEILSDKSLAVRQKAMIRDLLNLRQNDHTWADPRNIFSNLLKVALLGAETSCFQNEQNVVAKPYFEKVISGVVMSAGGLSSTTSKEATAALIRFAKTLKESKSVDLLGRSFLGLMENNKNDGRVIVSVLKSLEALLLHQCFDPLVQETQSPFAENVCSRLDEECTDCADIKRLMLITDVAVALLRALPPNAASEPRVVRMLCGLLQSAYPRIRAHVSQHLYVVLHELPHLIKTEKNVEVLDMIVDMGTEMNRESVWAGVAGLAQKLGVAVAPLSEPEIHAN